VSEEEFLSLI